MKKRGILLVFGLVTVLLVAGFCLHSGKGAEPLALMPVISASGHPEVPVAAEPGFAVVELFTSEGCSSCPPADELLAKIASEYKDNVYVLGFHVDYWDRLGWKDAYSNAAYTRRQQEYGRAFKLSSIYTPEAVVNGEKEMVGSEENTVRSAILEDLKKPGGKKIVLQAMSNGDTVKVNFQVADRGKEVLYIALVQSHAETRVGAGENSGRTLQHINIVRDLKAAPKGNSGMVEFALPAGLQAKDCKLIAFLQRDKAGDLAVSGAAGAELP